MGSEGVSTFDRASGIGGSDIAAILGVSPFRSEFDVYLEKTHDPAWSPVEETARMRLGKLLEPALRSAYEQDHPGSMVRAHPSGGPFAQPVWHANRIAYAHLDGLIEDDPSLGRAELGGLWEGKSAGDPRDWREGDAWVVPDYYEAQVRQYLAITGEPWCDVSVLFLSTAEFRHIRIDADPGTDAGIIDIGASWWNEHPATRTPPSIDGSEAAARFLSHRAKLQVFEPAMAAPEEVDELARQLIEVRRQEKQIEASRRALENKIKDAMGNYAKIRGTGWHATWKRNRESKVVAWELVAEAYRKLAVQLASAPSIRAVRQVFADADPDAILSLYTTTKDGNHPFVLKTDEKEAR